MTPRPGGWATERARGRVRELLGTWPEDGATDRRVLRVCQVTDGAVVLGSTQSEEVVDAGVARHRGVDVLRRRSGGGAVLVEPGEQSWVDVWIARHDSLWDDDVVRSSWWLGETWVRALESTGAGGFDVHRGRASVDERSRLVCFAGTGPGEVLAGGRKVVGLAQRRTRRGALFSMMVLRRWQPEALASLLSAPARATAGDLESVACGVDEWPGESADGLNAVQEAFVALLADGE